MAVAHCVNNSEKSAQGVTTPCYKKRIATPHAARNDNFNYTYALKNNFIIPNLVKTILTSITFDSLSRKIKNPCLTIKKFISKGVCNMKHTKNILKSLLITVMALSLLAVSCKKDEGGSKPTDPTPITITAAMMTAELQKINVPNVIDFTGKTPVSGSVDITALTDSYKTLKDTFEAATITGVDLVKDYQAKPASGQDAIKVTITIIAKSGYVLDAKMADTKEYTYDAAKKTAELVINLKPSKDWKD